MNEYELLEGTGGMRFVARSGPCISAGVFLPLAAGFNIGALARYTDIDADNRRELGGCSWGWRR